MSDTSKGEGWECERAELKCDERRKHTGRRTLGQNVWFARRINHKNGRAAVHISTTRRYAMHNAPLARTHTPTPTHRSLSVGRGVQQSRLQVALSIGRQRRALVLQEAGHVRVVVHRGQLELFDGALHSATPAKGHATQAHGTTHLQGGGEEEEEEVEW